MALTYHAPTKRFVIDKDALEHTAMSLRYAMQKIRETAKLPMEPYKLDGCTLEPADHAQKALIDLAEHLGIDLGAKWGNELDLRERA